MSKKHFIALADAIRESKPWELPADADPEQIERHYGAMSQWEHDRDTLARFCAEQNYRFNRQRWLDYIAGDCGPGGGAIKKQTAGAVA